MLLLSLIPTYLLITWSFKNGLQYRWERWAISFPLRWRNYVAAWDIVGDYMINTIIVALFGLMGMLLLSLIGGYVFARMDLPLPRNTLLRHYRPPYGPLGPLFHPRLHGLRPPRPVEYPPGP